jgi:sulfate permease, SulP family
MSTETTSRPGTLTRSLPILGGIRPYDRGWLTRDVVAGVTLAALAIPEVMGYTKIAGTPVITGLYTILFPVLAFALLGSSRHLVVGGDSATAAIMFAGIAGLGIAGLQPNSPEWLALASLSALLAAALLFLARLARLGFLANFISRTVLVGFLTGVGIQVALGQLDGLLGVPAPTVDPGRTSGTLIKAWDTLKEIGQTSGATLAVAVGVIATILVFDRWIKAIPGGLVAVVGAIALSWIFDFASHGVSTLGHVPSGLPHIGFPSGVGWSDATALLATSASIFLVVLAQSAATSRAYAVKYQERFIENDDLVGLSAANLAAGFSGTFVVNGSPTKTEMVDEAKSHTQVAQLTTAAVVAIVLVFLTKPLQYLPNAVLAAVVFLIGLKLVDIANMREILRLRRDEFWVAALTAGVVVCVGVEQGIILAIVLSVILHVRRHYMPRDRVISWDERGRTQATLPRPGARSTRTPRGSPTR